MGVTCDVNQSAASANSSLVLTAKRELKNLKLEFSKLTKSSANSHVGLRTPLATSM